jgi:hypothetical protein
MKFRKLTFSLGCMLGCVGLICGIPQALAADAIVGGDFATLDAWEMPKASDDVERKIISENSPFTDVFSDNGSCFSAKNSQRDVIRQEFAPVSGKAIWSFDFRMKAGDPEADAKAGHLVILFHGGERHSQVNVGRTARFNQFLSTTKETEWSPPKDFELQEDTWWNFFCEIDFESKTYNVTIRSAAGDIIESGPLDFPQEEGKDLSAVDGFAIRGGGGGLSKSAEMHFDNVSLRPAP